jgi:hypothetical protein
MKHHIIIHFMDDKKAEHTVTDDHRQPMYTLREGCLIIAGEEEFESTAYPICNIRKFFTKEFEEGEPIEKTGE